MFVLVARYRARYTLENVRVAAPCPVSLHEGTDVHECKRVQLAIAETEGLHTHFSVLVELYLLGPPTHQDEQWMTSLALLHAEVNQRLHRPKRFLTELFPTTDWVQVRVGYDATRNLRSRYSVSV